MALWTSLQTECLYQADLHTIFKSLNILSKVGWVINSDVLKVAEAVLALSLMGTAVSFQRLTEAFRQLHFPELFVLVLDLSIRYLVILGHYSGALLEAVTMRSVGTVSWKHSGAGGILGTTFLKSQQMAQQTEEAMRLRGFDGAYPALNRSRFGLRDVLILSADVLALLFFVYTQLRIPAV